MVSFGVRTENWLGSMPGRPKGAAEGVIVVEPITITGAVAEAEGSEVPVSTAVTVVEDITSVRVMIPAGTAGTVGFVV